MALTLTLAAIAGALSGALSARWLIRRERRRRKGHHVPLTDPAMDAEIERAAAAWAHSQGRPEATALMADKLHMLHRIGRSRRWWQ